jgi:hypothetical protein
MILTSIAAYDMMPFCHVTLRVKKPSNRYHCIEFKYMSVDHINCEMSKYYCRTIT